MLLNPFVSAVIFFICTEIEFLYNYVSGIAIFSRKCKKKMVPKKGLTQYIVPYFHPPTPCLGRVKGLKMYFYVIKNFEIIHRAEITMFWNYCEKKKYKELNTNNVTAFVKKVPSIILHLTSRVLIYRKYAFDEFSLYFLDSL